MPTEFVVPLVSVNRVCISLKTLRNQASHDSALLCLEFPSIQERNLIKTPPSSQLRHWMNHTSRSTGPAWISQLYRADQSLSSFPSMTSSTHEFQMLRSHANSEALPLVQLAAEMTLLRVASMTLLLNLTMNLPLTQPAVA